MNSLDTPINKLRLFGTHDSAAYRFNNVYLPGEIGGVNLKVAEFARRYIPFFNSVISDWTLTQDRRIKLQLQLGIRAFDFRLSASDKGRLYLSHSFSCISLEEALTDIAEFMDSEEGKDEVIFIWATVDKRHPLEQKHKDAYIDCLKIYLGDMIAPHESEYEVEVFDSNEYPTLGECIMRNQRIFLIGKLHPWWEKMYKSMKEVNLQRSPNRSVVVEDIRNRILHPCRYQPKSLRSWRGTTEENYYKAKESGSLEDCNFVWCDFPVECIIVDFYS